MEKEKAVREINSLIDEIREEWTADDGGLTISGGDAVATGNKLIEAIEAGNAGFIMALDYEAHSSTDVEENMMVTACQWAGPELRCQIEKVLRKTVSDEKTIRIAEICGIKTSA